VVPGPAVSVNQAPRWLTALFLLAVAGVLVSVGAVLGRVAGVVAVVVYVLVLAAVAVALVRLVRLRVRAAAGRATGRSCTCCAGTVHDPVQVV
jgi:hypothetical protein